MSDWRVWVIGWTAAACLALAACNGGTETVTGGDAETPDTVNSNSGQNDNNNQNSNANGNANEPVNDNSQTNGDLGQQNNASGDFPSPQ